MNFTAIMDNHNKRKAISLDAETSGTNVRILKTSALGTELQEIRNLLAERETTIQMLEMQHWEKEMLLNEKNTLAQKLEQEIRDLESAEGASKARMQQFSSKLQFQTDEMSRMADEAIMLQHACAQAEQATEEKSQQVSELLLEIDEHKRQAQDLTKHSGASVESHDHSGFMASTKAIKAKLDAVIMSLDIQEVSASELALHFGLQKQFQLLEHRLKDNADELQYLRHQNNSQLEQILSLSNKYAVLKKYIEDGGNLLLDLSK